LYLKFWGTRGSIPRATDGQELVALIERLANLNKLQGNLTISQLRDAVKQTQYPLTYGGNTSCTEVGSDDDCILIDMGSGIRDFGSRALQRGVTEYHIFMTHMHWDHIIGMPFFTPIYAANCKVNIYHVHRNAPEFIKINFNGVNFPLKWEQLSAKIEFHQLKLYEETRCGSKQQMIVRPFSLDHPGGSFGYRVDCDRHSVAIGVDGEYKRLTREELGRDLEFYQGLDVLVFDGQYEMSELASRFDWGHCSPNIGVDLAMREGIRCLVFTHHDPWSSAEKVDRMYEIAAKHLRGQLPLHRALWESLGQSSGPELKAAYDGMVLKVGQKT
jgi:phosphoribosyl 1,2-cyclic phosphodiesterase